MGRTKLHKVRKLKEKRPYASPTCEGQEIKIYHAARSGKSFPEEWLLAMETP